MEEKRKKILCKLFALYLDGTSITITAEQLFNELSKEFASKTDFMNNLNLAIRKQQVKKHTAGNFIVSIDDKGIEICERDMKSYRQRFIETLGDERIGVVAFLSGIAGIVGAVVGAVLTYILMK